ncbi:MAG: type I restriction endonuclease subunit R, partial [Algicola sp.]|nr:type I restriction endonuclease subunit R [Algicola sp.]
TISSAAQHYADWKDPYPFTEAQLLCGEMPADLTPVTNKLAEISLSQYAANVKNFTGVNYVTAQQKLLAGMLNPTAFLDLLQNFVIFEPVEGKLIKKVARYQQFRAVNKVIERLKTGKTRKDKSGVVWHTQGSGKSLTMVMLAVKMRRDSYLRKFKLVFITDRTQLDTQLTNTFMAAQKEAVNNADSVVSLKALLKKDASDLVTAMVQKFIDLEKLEDSDFGDLNASDKIIVLADEAHRTQFGSLAMTINAALPNAPKIGFTGTPLQKSQKMDDAFGGYIDKYKINEAVEDGATVRLLYEGREVKTEVSGDSLDNLFDEYFADYSKEQKEQIKQKFGVERAVREAPARIRWVCIDLLKHYREHIQPDGFKAMIVTGSRHAAVLYKKTLDELGAPPSDVIISGKHNDYKEFIEFADKTRHKESITNFKKPLKEHPLSFLIVKDMLLTGFDAPIAQVMYIDRKLQDHTLMQAIARVNRTYTYENSNKACGFVVDYYGLSEHLLDAMKAFTSDDVEGTYHSLKDEIPRLKATHTTAMGFFKGIDLDNTEACVLALKDEAIRAKFDIAFKNFARQMNIVLPDSSAQPFLYDLRKMGKAHNEARTRYREERMDMTDIGEKVRQLVDEHILSTGVDPKIAPVDLLAANFKESLNKIKSTESKASELESAIKHHLTVHLDEDPEYYKSLSLKLKEIILQHAGQWELQLELLSNLGNDIETNHKKAATDIGLTPTEYAFYNILMAEIVDAQDSDLVDETTFNAIKTTTTELVKTFDEATQIVDFFRKDDEVKRMKKIIKRTVLDQPFGNKDLVVKLQARFIELAKTKFGQNN